MVKYFLPLVLFAFLSMYFFFEKARIRKLKQRLKEEDLTYLKKIEASLNFSLLLITGALSFVTCYAFFPDEYVFEQAPNRYELIHAIGALIIKISFVSLLISGLLIAREIDSSPQPLLFKNIYRSECLMLFLVVFLNCGVFVCTYNAGTLLLFSLSVFSFFRHSKMLRSY